MPQSMLDTCIAMASYLRNLLTVVDGRPIFRLPPKDVHFVAGIDELPQLAGNELACSAIRGFCAIGQSFGGVPTVMMLDATVASIDETLIERVPLSTFGRVATFSRGGGAGGAPS
jgi:hypothetical protein